MYLGAEVGIRSGKDVTGEGQPPVEIARGGDVSGAPLAEMLFMIPDVTRVFFGADYISVTKGDDAQWKHLKPAVLGAIMDFYVAGGQPIIDQLQAGDFVILMMKTARFILKCAGLARAVRAPP